MFNRQTPFIDFRFRIYRETLSRFSCAASDGTVLVNYQKLIPALDPDGDTTKFRMANTSELGGGANPGGMSIDENTGLLTWTNSGNLTAGLYSAGIVVEDYDDQGNMKSKTHYDIMWELKGAAEIADYSG